MTRKDYIAISTALRAAMDDARGFVQVQLSIDRAARDIAAHMQRDNARFDRARFITACGVPS